MDFDKYTEDYNSLIKKSTCGIISKADAIAEYKAYMLRQVVSRDPDSILDFGCGIGNNLNALSSAYSSADIFGFDISKKSLEAASVRCPSCSFIRQEELDNFKDSFDIVFVSCVLHHIPQDSRIEFARRAFDLLKPGGSIAIIEHNIYNPLTMAAVSLCPYDRDAILIRASRVRNLLSCVGFIERSSRYMLFAPPSWRRFRTIEGLLRHTPLGGQHITTASKPLK